MEVLPRLLDYVPARWEEQAMQAISAAPNLPEGPSRPLQGQPTRFVHIISHLPMTRRNVDSRRKKSTESSRSDIRAEGT